MVAVALTKAKEFGLDTVGCASTGNLANAVAAGAAAAGLRAVVLVPEDLEAAKLTATAVYGATLVGVRGQLRPREPPVRARSPTATAGASST